MKRIKKCYSSSYDVMHIFAQRTQSEAYNQSRNVFFEDDCIYSYGYHYKLAHFISDKAIVINDRGYSVTTGKHISQVSLATSQYDQFLITKIDLIEVESTINELIDKLVKARKPELYLSQINSLWAAFNDFQDYIRKNNINTSFKINKSRSEYKALKKLCETALSENSRQELIKIEKARIKAEKLKRQKEAKESIKKFYNHELNYIHGLDRDILRLSVDGSMIETSQGVKVSVKAAKMLYMMIKAGKDIIGHKIEHYTVISVNGTLKIGCHNMNMDDVHKVGKQLLNL